MEQSIKKKQADNNAPGEAVGVERVIRRCDSCFYLEIDPVDKFCGCLKGHWEGDDGKKTETDHWRFCKDYRLDA